MNRVTLTGRLTADPIIRAYTKANNEQSISAWFVLAVSEGKEKTEFIPMKAFGRYAEFVEKYLHKGMKMIISGKLHSQSEEKDGKRKTSLEVWANEFEFASAMSQASGRSWRSEQNDQSAGADGTYGSFMEDIEDCPFN